MATYLKATAIIDRDHPRVVRYAESIVKNVEPDPRRRAVALYYAVRDDIWYDPYFPFYLPRHYRASYVLEKKRGYCVSKAALLCALGRVCGIPARVGFATVRNHLATTQLIEHLGSDLFVYHGYVEFFLDGRWIKATPAFNRQLCEKHQVSPLEFDGRSDSVFQSYNLEHKRFMEYITEHGVFADIPVKAILAAWEKAYGKDRVRRWIRGFERSGEKSGRNFYTEDTWKE